MNRWTRALDRLHRREVDEVDDWYDYGPPPPRDYVAEGLADGRVDVTSMPDPMNLPIGRYFTSRAIHVRAHNSPDVIDMRPGDNLTVRYWWRAQNETAAS